VKAPTCLPEGARELHLHDRNGKPVVMLITSSRLALHDRTLLVCVLKDVTELRRLERAVLSDARSARDQVSIEVHEGIAQNLTGIALLLNGVGDKSKSDAATLKFIVGHVNQVLERARAGARALAGTGCRGLIVARPIAIGGGSIGGRLDRRGLSQRTRRPPSWRAAVRSSVPYRPGVSANLRKPTRLSQDRH
jgi:hypothetical protein